MKVNMKTTRYFSWLLQSKKNQKEFKSWLTDNGYDVFEGNGLAFNEVIKFKYKKTEGVLWVTGYANPVFIMLMKKFKDGL
jgi:hypothetical protein